MELGCDGVLMNSAIANANDPILMASAMKQLKSKLYELEMQKRNSENQETEDGKSDIGWGHQIRSYGVKITNNKNYNPAFKLASINLSKLPSKTS
jgi:hypothetical protein